jgi:hypothetical protein
MRPLDKALAVQSVQIIPNCELAGFQARSEIRDKATPLTVDDF